MRILAGAQTRTEARPANRLEPAQDICKRLKELKIPLSRGRIAGFVPACPHGRANCYPEDYEHLNSAARPTRKNAKPDDALLKHHLTPQRS
jgi:hypothetical protein